MFVVCLFHGAGQYTCKEGRNSPCLVYVGFNHKIYVYWRVGLERMEPTNLLRLLEQRPAFQGLLQQLGLGEWRAPGPIRRPRQAQARG